MGGSSLAPEMITRTAGVNLVVLDSTHPGHVQRVLSTDIEATVVVVSSKSGSTTETDSLMRAFRGAFEDAGIDPVARFVIVTDPGSPLDDASRDAGYSVFNADPTVGGRFSALTAFGLVPSGLAGVDIAQLLDEADAVLGVLSVDNSENPGLVLGAAIAANEPHKDKMIIKSDQSSFVGIGEWIEQLVAESTGKLARGILPVVADEGYPTTPTSDSIVVSIVDFESPTIPGDVVVAGELGAQVILWEVATAVAGRILGVNPFDQPDVESAKIATRAFLDAPARTSAASVVDGDVALSSLGYTLTATTLVDALTQVIGAVQPDGYIAVHAYADSAGPLDSNEVQGQVARASERPATFGWGPRFLHSTGQYHKGGPEQGVFIQIVDESAVDVEIPGKPYSFGRLLSAQASGDADVLARNGRTVLTLTTRSSFGLAQIAQAFSKLS
jgi:glucose-6-phosphate isomerase